MRILQSILSAALFFLTAYHALGQNMSINASGAKPHNSAMLDVKSTSSGILIPRMTQAQRNAITSPANGLLTYQTDANTGIFRYDSVSGAWVLIPDSAQVELIGADNLGDHTATQNIALSGFRLTNDGDNEGLAVDNSGRVSLTPATTGAGVDALVTNGDIRTAGLGTGIYFTNNQIGITGNNGNSGDMRFATGSTDRIRLTGGGDVGIGTMNPGGKLDIFSDGSLLGGARISATTLATVGAALYFNAAATDWTITATNSSSSSGSDRLVFRNYSGASDVLTMSSSGEVGIGTNNPSALLEVTGNTEIPANNDYRYSTAKTGYASVPAGAFTLIDVSGLGAFEDGFTSGNARWTSGGLGTNDAYMYAAVQLPDSAIIQEVIFYVYDNDLTYNVSGELSRHNLGSSIVNDMATTGSTTGQPGTTSLNDNTVGFATVDNSAYSYFLVFNTKESNSNLRIYGARIEYQIYKTD